MGNRLDKATLDEIFSNSECLIDVNLIATLGKSDYTCFEIEVKVKLFFLLSKQKKTFLYLQKRRC